MMIGRDDDQGLIDACRRGQTEAFGMLVRRYQDRLYPTVLRLTGSAEDAHDLLQETFLRAYRKLGQFQGGSSFYTWVYRIAVNLALGERRRRKTARPALDLTAHDRFDPPDDRAQTDPAAPLEREERDARIQNALSALAPDHRAVVVLKDLDGLRYEEIAEMLKIPVGTVRSRLHRARHELRLLLHGILEEDHVRQEAR